jgi:hypothetical protein
MMTDSKNKLTARPAFGILVLGILLIVISLVLMLGFYATPHANGIDSDFGAQIGLAPIVYAGIGLGSTISVIAALRLFFFR